MYRAFGPRVREKSAAGVAAGLQIPAGSYRGKSSSATTCALVHGNMIRVSFGRASDRRVAASLCAICGHAIAKGAGAEPRAHGEQGSPPLRSRIGFAFEPSESPYPNDALSECIRKDRTGRCGRCSGVRRRAGPSEDRCAGAPAVSAAPAAPGRNRSRQVSPPERLRSRGRPA